MTICSRIARTKRAFVRAKCPGIGPDCITEAGLSAESWCNPCSFPGPRAAPGYLKCLKPEKTGTNLRHPSFHKQRCAFSAPLREGRICRRRRCCANLLESNVSDLKTQWEWEEELMSAHALLPEV